MDRFDLEQKILGCWQVTEDIGVLHKRVLEGNREGKDISKDDISNFLLGLETIYNAKFDELFHTLEMLIKEGKI